MQLTNDMADKVKSAIGYDDKHPKTCAYCKHYASKRDSVAYNDGYTVCLIAGELGHFEVSPNATCNRFSKRS